ncbi:hypothetical protein ACHAP8_004673 [Fusarium lateritium]
MSFLRGNALAQGQETDYLCEAQVSVMIAAINKTVWTGYCFVDTYHEPVERRKTVHKYCKSKFDPDVVQQDPFIDHESENPILDPGEYFLTSLDCQLKVFKHEWEETNRMFTERVKEYVRTSHTLLGSPTSNTKPKAYLKDLLKLGRSLSYGSVERDMCSRI